MAGEREQGEDMTEHDTRAMQVKLATQMHRRYCPMIHPQADGHSVHECFDRARWMSDAAFIVMHLLPAMTRELVIPTQQATREAVAREIEAELVCCDLYEQVDGYLEAHPEDIEVNYRELARRAGADYHSICHWGGYAAAIAREGRKRPCVANGGSRPCEPNYFCPTSGEVESPCHGGFDTCCNRPEGHRAAPSSPVQEVDGFHNSERLTDRRWGERYVTGAGQSLWVHKRVDCKGPWCVIHAWPPHLDRRLWKTYWRSDTRVMELVCLHGVGHPSPTHIDRTGVDSLHGCDGCCEVIKRGEADVRAAGSTRSAAE